MENKCSHCVITLLDLGQVRIGANTAEHDLELKLKAARAFVEKGYRVKLTVLHKRMQSEAGQVKLQDVATRAARFAQVLQPQLRERMQPNTHAVYLAPSTTPTV